MPSIVKFLKWQFINGFDASYPFCLVLSVFNHDIAAKPWLTELSQYGINTAL